MSLFFATLAVAFGMVFSMPGIPHRFLSIILLVAFFYQAAKSLLKTRKFTKTQFLQAYILSFFLLYQLLKAKSTIFYFFLSKISEGFSSFIGLLARRPVRMGITYSGIDSVVLFMIALTVLFFMYQRIAVKKLLAYMSAGVVIWGFYIGLWTLLAESSLTLGLNLLEPVTGPLDYRALLFALLFSLFTIAGKGTALDNGQGEMNLIAKFLPVAVVLFCTAVLAVSGLMAGAPVKRGVKQVVFWDTGIDFSVPEDGKYGLDYAGMFGVLPHYLNRNGYQCKISEKIDSTLLGEADVLVVFNPMRLPGDAELSAITRFVENGGSVLAAGDHTGQGQVRLPLNKILAPAAISFNFDSAVPFKSLWGEGYRLRQSPIFSGTGSRAVQIVVGASLDLGFRAKPLVIGKEGFSDQGDINNTADGYLGDMLFNRGERIGDLPLAAEASYGKGKYMVFGDTTPFQNTVIPYSYPVVDHIFANLSGNGKQSRAEWENDGFFKASCIIDASHMPLLSWDKSGNAADGLIANAMRVGLMPYLNQNKPLSELLSNQGDVKLLILMAPAISFSEEELQSLETFMATGGAVLLCAGYDSPPASAEFAARFGFYFDP
ncbi:MAG: DUF4350 domain-containing protein, partial [Clostridiales bacterium]|nr:DUF4350 domain-containing protein [Clostridiales bacterium]